MFFKLATLLSLTLAVVSAPDGSTCGTGKLQCCDSISPAGSTNSADSSPADVIPIALQGLNVPLGINCLPISVIGAGSSGTCSAQAACCNGVDNTGAVPIGVDCDPVNLGL